MPKTNDAWGIEVGANAIKAVRLIRKKEEVIVADYDVLPFKKVLTTPDINVEEAIQVNLDQLLARHELNKSMVLVSVPGSMAFARFAKLPPVDPKRIPDIVRFEAMQQIPFPINDVEWDYQVFQQEDSPDIEVGIVAITKDRVNRFLDNYHAVGIEPDGVVLSPMAVYNAMVYDMNIEPDGEGLIIVDIGTSSTDLVIVENGQIWMRTMAIGGNNFTEALVRAFKLSFPKAERLKREAGTSKYARQIFQAMRPVFADLVQELQRSLGFYQQLNRDSKLNRLVGLGSTFRLPGMQKFLKQQLQLEVIRPDRYQRVSVDGKQEADFAEHAMNMATAYGLALQGLGLEAVTTNLLPRPIIRKKVWKQKTPWFIAAASLMVLAAVGTEVRYQAASSSWEAAKGPVESTVARAEGNARRLSSDWDSVARADTKHSEIEQLRSMLDYRSVWPALMLDLQEALQSLNPQEPLLTSNYSAIQEIPAGQRRRLYFESITARYMNVPLISLLPEQRTGAGTAPPAAATPAPAEVTPAADSIWQKWGNEEPAPTFEITITGHTPFASGRQLILTEYLPWLQENAERQNRPYRLVGGPRSLVNIVQDTARPTTATRTTPTTPATTGRRPPVSSGMMDDAPPSARGGFMDSERPPSAGQPGAPRPAATSEITRPEPEADAPGLWRFTLRFHVQLLKPVDVRQAEDILAGVIEERPAPELDPAVPEDAEAAAEHTEEVATLTDREARS